LKSKIEALENRGFVAATGEAEFLNSSYADLVWMLKSNIPTNRTIAARLLAGNTHLSTIDRLIEALAVEHKLYSKIEICNSLVSFGLDAVVPLINVLGKIGSNQYAVIPEAEFKKINYPLPRDIASRTLVRIGTLALPDLIKILSTKELNLLTEVIDTIGYICFYADQAEVFGLLKRCYDSNLENDLIRWKILRAMSAFPESESFLSSQLEICNDRLKLEIKRSLYLVRKRGNKTRLFGKP
jgi:hypothetical protein